MRRVFISYAREAKPDVDQIVEHLKDLGFEAWHDSLLNGGQVWWQEILRQIVDCEIFMAIMSDKTLDSMACQRELDWAELLGKPVLPVVVQQMSRPLPGRYSKVQFVDYCDRGTRDTRAARVLARSLYALPAGPPLPNPLPEPPAVPLSNLTNLTDLVASPTPLSGGEQREIFEQLETALLSTDREEQSGARDVIGRFLKRRDLDPLIREAMSQLIRAGEPVAAPAVSRLGPPDDDMWEDLLSHLSDRLLIPVVGPDLAVAKAGTDAQTLTTIIGHRLVDRFGLTCAMPSEPTMDDAVASFLREHGQDEGDRLYHVINRIHREIDPEPTTGLRDLAAIDAFTLFVSTTPDRMLARALNDVRFEGRARTREIAYNPVTSTTEQEKNAQPATAGETVVLNLFGQVSPRPNYAIHEEDRLEWLHSLQGTGSLPDWLSYVLAIRPIVFIGCEFSDPLGRTFLRAFSRSRLSTEINRFYFVGTPGSHAQSFSNFLGTFGSKRLAQQAEMDPTEFVAELRERWEARRDAEPRTARPPSPSRSTSPEGSIFISYIREDADAARRLATAINNVGGDVLLDEYRLAPGDQWLPDVLDRIREEVRLFIPVISTNTERLEECYIFREWKEAAERSRRIVGRPFVIPIIVDPDFDGDLKTYQRMPSEFRQIAFGHAPAGEPDPKLIEALIRAIREIRRTHAV